MLTAQAQHPACADEATLRLQATVHVAAFAYKGCVKWDALGSTTATSRCMRQSGSLIAQWEPPNVSHLLAGMAHLTDLNETTNTACTATG